MNDKCVWRPFIKFGIPCWLTSCGHKYAVHPDELNNCIGCGKLIQIDTRKDGGE